MNNFNYNSFFYPNYNLFNSNIDYRQIGIGGVKNPQNFVDIHGNINTERLNIIGNINYNQNNNTNSIKIIQQTNTGLLQDKELYNTNSEWLLENNELQLILKNDEFNDELYYYSNIYDLDTSGNVEINIKTSQRLILKYIYVDYGNNTHIAPSNISITVDNVNYISTLVSGTTNLYKFDSEIILSNTLNKLNFIDISSSIQKVQLIGNYISSGSSHWLINNYDLSINNNIGIFTNNPTSNLHINGNMYITENLVINNNIKCNNLNSNNLIVENLNIENIESTFNYLYINNNNNNIINIGVLNNNNNNNNDNNDNVLNIHNNFIISHNFIQSSYLNVKKNLHINNAIKSNNFNIKLNDNQIIYANNTNNLLVDNNKEVYIKDKLNIISNNDENNYKLCVDGNIYIDGDLNLSNNPFTQTQTQISTENDLNQSILQCDYSSLLSNNINVINNINVNILNINNEIILPNYTTTNPLSIYFDNINNRFIYIDIYNNLKQLSTSISSTSAEEQEGFYNLLTINDNFKINNQEIYMNANIEREELIINNVLKRFHISY
tara:strand:- start:4406 stop:6061 length:1656 start_codon:yes stop_codon:yes gene_type:complete